MNLNIKKSLSRNMKRTGFGLATLLSGVLLWNAMTAKAAAPQDLESRVTQQTTFEHTYGGTDYDSGASVQQTSDGGYIIAGMTRSFGAGKNDVYLVKTDAAGDTLWTRTFGGAENDVGFSVQQTSDGGYILAGATDSFGAGGNDVFLVKTDANGNSLWTTPRTFGGAKSDWAQSVQQVSDGGYIITGVTLSSGAGKNDIYLIKTDASGNAVWEKTFGGAGLDNGYSVQQVSDGGYVIAGVTQSFGAGTSDFFLVKTDADGNAVWSRTFGGSKDDTGWSVQQASDGGYVIAGGTNSFGAGKWDFFLVKTDASGNALWERTFGGVEDDCGFSVQQASDGGYIISGYTASSGAGKYDVYLVKTDADGNSLWTRTFGGAEDDIGWAVRQTSDKGYIIAGDTGSFGAGNNDVYLIKTDASGSTPVEEEDPERIDSFQLFQNYPNPFNLETVIEYQVPKKSRVTLKVFDMLGREIKTLVDMEEGPGYKTAQWDGRDADNSIVPSGVYIYQIRAKDFVQSKKLTVVK
ncbi:MAG: T9SS type A sorting domain-containing protein [bacterium]